MNKLGTASGIEEQDASHKKTFKYKKRKVSQFLNHLMSVNTAYCFDKPSVIR